MEKKKSVLFFVYKLRPSRKLVPNIGNWGFYNGVGLKGTICRLGRYLITSLIQKAPLILKSNSGS